MELLKRPTRTRKGLHKTLSLLVVTFILLQVATFSYGKWPVSDDLGDHWTLLSSSTHFSKEEEASPVQMSTNNDTTKTNSSSSSPSNKPFHQEDGDTNDEQVTLSIPKQWAYLFQAINASTEDLATDSDLLDFANSTRLTLFDEMWTLPKSIILESFSKGNDGWLKRQRKIDEVFDQTEGADAKSPIGIAFAFSPPSTQALALSNTSVLLEYASRAFLKSMEEEGSGSKPRVKRQTVLFGDEDPDAAGGIGVKKEIDLRNFVVSQGSMGTVQCGLSDEVLPCDPKNPYRTYTGWCNNIRNPGRGKSVITFDRMLAPAYADGVSSPRSTSVTGRPLPSPRQISSYVHVDVSHLSNRHTLMLMQYAQFLDHDMTLTPVHKGPEQKILNCKECDSPSTTHPECWPIPVPQGDAWYPDKRETGSPYCIPFTRSLPGQQRLGPREQINQNSAYIDASQIYGEEVCKANSLRVRGGYLNGTGSSGRKALMPQTSTLRECRSPSGYCFNAGDPRASEQPALATVHTIFLRQHNHWIDEIRRINPHWNEEKAYQEVRKIMGAANQHIAYNELLPRILGPGMVNSYGLALQNDGYYAGYDPSCSATVLNEFAAAAFRFGHSLIRPNLARMDGRYNGMAPHISLRDGFFNSDMLYKPLMVDEVARGLIAEPMEQMDPFVTQEVTNHLFEDKKRTFSGLDLVALNTQRGRDHGLPGYNNYRAVCNLGRARSFQDLSAQIPQDVLQRLQTVYAHVDDIDLFTGSLVERPVTGGLVGPTMSCIIGTQFKRLRQCDRFWYESNDPSVRFSPQQLSEIRKVTLSKIVCDSMEHPTDIQRWAMDAPHNALNPRLPCNRLAQLNLEPWKEQPPAQQPQPQRQPSRPLPLVSPKEPGFGECNIGGKRLNVGGSALQSPCVSCVCTPQGTKCASLRIISCSRLFQEASRSDILRDPVCTSQCGFFMGPQTPSRFSVNSFG